MGWLPTAIALLLIGLFAAVVVQGMFTGDFGFATIFMPLAIIAASFFLGQQAFKIVRVQKEKENNHG